MGFLYALYKGGTLINVFRRVYFHVFRQSSRFKVRPSKQSSFYVFGVFVDSRGGGTLDKRIPEGLFICYFIKIIYLYIYIYGVFIGIIGGTPDKRICEGRF